MSARRPDQPDHGKQAALLRYLSLDVQPNIGDDFGNDSLVRVLTLDHVECLFTFICSANNNATRIRRMVESLCCRYGEGFVELECDGKTFRFPDFPTIERLSQSDIPAELGSLSFGYRAKYINKAAIYLSKKGGRDFLREISAMPYQEARAELIKIPGVGTKVADCVLLMSMRHWNVVPIDTHMRQYALNHFKVRSCKSLTKTSYDSIARVYAEKWGDYAGWIQASKFVAMFDHGRLKTKDKHKKKK